MLRMAAILLILSGGWVTIEALAYWREAADQQADGQTGPVSLPSVTMGVPAELIRTNGWARVNKPAEPAEPTLDDEPEAASDGEAGVDAAPAAAAAGKPTQPKPASEIVKTAIAKPEQTQTEPAEASEADLPAADQLVAAIQTELRRLGYYTGKVDNIWGRGSRSAVRKFNREHQTDFPQAPAAELFTALKAVESKPGEDGEKLRDMGSLQSATASGEASYLPPWMNGGASPERSASTPRPSSSEKRQVQRVRRSSARKYETRRRARAPKRRSFRVQIRDGGFAWPFF